MAFLDKFSPSNIGRGISDYTRQNLPPVYHTARFTSGAIGYGAKAVGYVGSKMGLGNTPQQPSAESGFLKSGFDKINPLSKNTTTSSPQGPLPQSKSNSGMNWGKFIGSQSGSDKQAGPGGRSGL